MVPFEKIFKALNKAKVRYLVAGGVAVNLHGAERATFDLDLIVHLEEKNLMKFGKVMTKLGYKPKVPVKPEDFADKQLRESWIKDKNMLVFSYINLKEPYELIDVFVDHPLPFDTMYANRKRKRAFATTVPIIGLKDLIKVKESAGRPKDLYDAGRLKALARDRK